MMGRQSNNDVHGRLWVLMSNWFHLGGNHSLGMAPSLGQRDRGRERGTYNPPAPGDPGDVPEACHHSYSGDHRRHHVRDHDDHRGLATVVDEDLVDLVAKIDRRLEKASTEERE